MELHGCRECLWMLSRMPMDVVEVAMHEVGVRGVAMLHDCFYTLRYTPPVSIRFAISTSIRSKWLR